MNILEEIASKKRKQIKIRERNKNLISFSDAILNKNKEGYLALISEIKPRSPSQGDLREIQDPVTIAKIMQDNGASGISVLTEENYFGGSIENLIAISGRISLPLLRKDFITSEAEIEESYNCNADAVLLIVGLLKKDTGKLFEMCKKVGLEALVEVHNKEELEIALKIGAEIIGINNRDLTTLKIDLKTTDKLIKLIPRDKIVISESGVKSKADAEYLTSLGASAILVGSALMQSSNIRNIIRELSSVKIP
ncbi:MAG: indole-3-glycerol-phosphate synthase [Candidatus Helarchaeota archaeon]|nr:indole-3-glycerol-phosphate synthase [Candidatus Helarchaeota archaeon]